MKRAALLLRCSTNIQDYNRQKLELEKVANRFKLKVAKVFGEHVTGKDDIRKGNRKSVDELINACENNEIDVVLISEVSRLTRNFLYGVTLVDKFNRDYSIPIYFRDKRKWTIDVETGEVNLEFEKELRKAFEQAEEELASIRFRMASGKRDSAGLGQWFAGIPPFGYTRQKNGYLVKNEYAPIVKEMFDKYLEEGQALITTTRYIYGKYPDIKKLKSIGNTKFILNNRAYTGRAEANIYDEIDKITDTFYFDIPAIIDEETYNKVQEKLAHNRTTTPYPKATKYLLQKLIKCSECGAFYTRLHSNKRDTVHFKCTSNKSSSTGCMSQVYLNERIVNPIIWNFIKEQLFYVSKMNAKQRLEAVAEENENKSRAIEEQEALKTSYKEQENKLTRLEDLYLDNDIDKNRYKERKSKIEKELTSIRVQMNKLTDRIRLSDFNIKRYNSTDFTEQYFNEVEADLEKQMKVLREYVKGIYPLYIDKVYCFLKVDTIEGMFNIFYEPRKAKQKCAYFINDSLAQYHPDIRNFYTPNNTLLTDSDEVDAYYTLEEMKEICSRNGFEVRYRE